MLKCNREKNLDSCSSNIRGGGTSWIDFLLLNFFCRLRIDVLHQSGLTLGGWENSWEIKFQFQMMERHSKTVDIKKVMLGFDINSIILLFLHKHNVKYVLWVNWNSKFNLLSLTKNRCLFEPRRKKCLIF